MTKLYICILFHILFNYGLSEDTEYRSPCYTVGPCLSILCSLYLLVPNSQSFLPSLTPATTSLISVRLFHRYFHLCHILILFTLFPFWLCWVFLTAWAFLYCSEQGLLSSCGVRVSLVLKHGLPSVCFGSFSVWAQ